MRTKSANGWKCVPAVGCCAGVMLMAMVLAAAGSPTQVTISVKDLTPKFLAFYEAATQSHANPEQRWSLWKEKYDFAAVPPTPEGGRMARKMLEGAWPKYPAALERIRQGPAALQPAPEQLLKRVAGLLEADAPVRMTLVVFVGSFDSNAFTSAGKDGTPTVAVPVEQAGLEKVLTHEFTHVVQAAQAGLSLGWERSVAHTVFTEGLAMRATQKLYPGGTDQEYVGEFTPNWYRRAEAKRQAILADLEPHLGESDSAAVMRYTMGEGGAGIDREAYYAGWLVIDDLLRSGWTWARLARVPDADMVKIVGESLTRLKKR